MTDFELVRKVELFKKMYCCLFNGITDAEQYTNRESVLDFLKKKQLEAEEMYIEFEENNMYVKDSDQK